MSARGGRPGGRGGGPGKGGQRLIGIDIDPELDSLADSAPSETFPPVEPPVAELPSAEERYCVDHYRFLRKRLHQGDFYTVLSDDARIKKTPAGRRIKEPKTAHFDPFEDQQTYAKRFKRKHNTLPVLSKRHFETLYFPTELWSTINPDDKTVAPKSLAPKKRLGQGIDDIEQDGTREDDEQEDGNKDDDDDAGDKKGDDDKDDDDDEKEGGGEDDEERDEDEFSDGDDNDDYNAEQYFDDGEEEEGERGGGDDFGGGGEDTY